MPNFDGNNTKDNEIKIDFRNKKVDFKPVKSDMEFIPEQIKFICVETLLITLFLVLMNLWTCVFMMFIAGKNFTMLMMVASTYLYSLFWVAGFITLMIIAFDKKKVHALYPKLNRYLMKYWTTLLFMRIEKRKKVTCKDIKNNKYRIDFMNMYLGYKVSGDMADKLAVIDIKNRKRAQDGWYGYFKFDAKPTNGELILEYI